MSGFVVPSRVLLALVLALSLAACPSSCSEATPMPEGDAGQASSSESPDITSNVSANDLAIVEIAPGEAHTIAVTADGSVWTSGNGGDGQLGWEQDDFYLAGIKVDGLPAIRDAAAGTGYSIFLAEDGTVWGAGYGFDERLGSTDSGRFVTPIELGIDGLKDVAAWTNYTLGRRSDDTVISFGVNDAGGLGHGSGADSATPVETGVVAVAIDAGGSYSLALTADGRVKAWGMNNYGTLGNAGVPTMDRSGAVKAEAQGFFSLSPVDVQIEEVVAISAGMEHALAAKKNGSVWGWGLNINGSLAQPGNNNLYPVPVQIEGLSDVVSVAAGGQFSLALTRDGTVLSWGYNSNGQLGRTIHTAYSTDPTPISGLPPIAKVVAGFDRAYAVDRDGHGWAWGLNEYGQLLAEGEGLSGPLPIQLSTR